MKRPLTSLESGPSIVTCAEDLACYLLQEGWDLLWQHSVALVPVLVIVVLLYLLLPQLVLLHHELTGSHTVFQATTGQAWTTSGWSHTSSLTWEQESNWQSWVASSLLLHYGNRTETWLVLGTQVYQQQNQTLPQSFKNHLPVARRKPRPLLGPSHQILLFGPSIKKHKAHPTVEHTQGLGFLHPQFSINWSFALHNQRHHAQVTHCSTTWE